MSTYVIGDVHGCYKTLRNLLNTMAFQAKRDTLWLTGDLVNRGPQSLEVLKLLSELPRVVSVLGNHDLFLLAIWAGFQPSQHEDIATLDAILHHAEADQLMHWLKHQPLIHQDEGHLLVHAGIPPQWPNKQATALSKEIEKKLQGTDYIDFLMHIEGNFPTSDPTLTEQHTMPSQLAPSENAHLALGEYDRLRYVVNAFTRMRFCTPDGTLNLQDKSSPSAPPQGFLPWYAHEQHKSFDKKNETQPKKIVFGHWAALEGNAQHPHVIALDTGCVWGKHLTGIRLDNHQMFQVPYSE